MNALQKLRSERGLTLVEIIVVLIILGILMGFLGQKIFGAGDKAKADITKLKLKELKSSVEQFQLRYNQLPSSLQALTECSAETGPDCVPITSKDGLKDAWNTDFVFNIEGSGRAYRIKTLGADGREGGEGVNFDSFITGP